MLHNLGFGRVRISFKCPRHHIPARNSARCARRARHLGVSDSGTNLHSTRVRVSRMTGVNNKLPQTKPCHTVAYHTIPCHTIPYHGWHLNISVSKPRPLSTHRIMITSYHIVSYHISSYDIVSWYYMTLGNVILRDIPYTVYHCADTRDQRSGTRC